MALIAITETWLNIGEKDNKVIKDLTPADYRFVHLPRKVALIVVLALFTDRVSRWLSIDVMI